MFTEVLSAEREIQFFHGTPCYVSTESILLKMVSAVAVSLSAIVHVKKPVLDMVYIRVLQSSNSSFLLQYHLVHQLIAKWYILHFLHKLLLEVWFQCSIYYTSSLSFP